MKTLVLLLALIVLSSCTLFNSKIGGIQTQDIKPLELHGPEYINYTKAGFELAKSQNYTIYLEFHASWCPECKAQEPKILAAFATMLQNKEKYGKVIGFKVDYDTEIELKRAYGITYQHSHVIINPQGTTSTRSIGEMWNSDIVIQKIDKAL